MATTQPQIRKALPAHLLTVQGASSSLKAAVYVEGKLGERLTQAAYANFQGVGSREREIRLEWVGEGGHRKSYTYPFGCTAEVKMPMANYEDPKLSECIAVGYEELDTFTGAFGAFSRMLEAGCLGAEIPLDSIAACGHKIAHDGGIGVKKEDGSREVLPVIANEQAIRMARENGSLFAPKHNPVMLDVLEAAMKSMPGIPHTMTFETVLHAGMPPETYLYALPLSWHEKYGVRRFGYHSCSHWNVAGVLGQMEPTAERVVSTHLGSGGSVCAMVGGRSVYISSGMTPEDGVMMATRPGSFDPSIIPFLMERHGLGIEEIRNALLKESGLLGIGGSQDMRVLLGRLGGKDEGAKNAVLAIKMFVGMAAEKIAAAMERLRFDVDALAFTGGIAEMSPQIRRWIAKRFENLGFRLDEDANDEAIRTTALVSTKEIIRGEAPCILDARVPKKNRIYIVETDEERMIAEDARDAINNSRIWDGKGFATQK